MKTFSLVLVVTLLAPLGARAAMISITPETELRLGDGVEPITERHFNSCVEYDPKDMYAEDDGNQKYSARKAELNLELVTSYQDFDRYTNTQISGSIKSLYGGGGFSYDSESKYTMHSDQAALGISNHADYGRWYIRQVRLKPELEALAKKDPKRFYEICGSEYVAGYILGQGIKVLLTTDQNSTFSYDRLQASMNASFNYGATSGKMDASFESVTTELIKNGMLKIHFFTYGAGEMKSTEAMIRDQTDIKNYREKIADIVSKIQGQDAVRITYLTRPYPGLTGQHDSILDEHKKQTISILFANYRRLYDTRRRLANIMGPQFSSFAERECMSDYKTYCEDYVRAIEQSQEFVERSIQLVDRLAQNCVTAKTIIECRLPTSNEVNMDVLSRVVWPNQFRYAMYMQMIRDIRDREKNPNPNQP